MLVCAEEGPWKQTDTVPQLKGGRNNASRPAAPQCLRTPMILLTKTPLCFYLPKCVVLALA